MSSKSIYTPYFYIIQDTRNSMYYAGSKWAQGCHPSDFMIEGGYITSSETVKELIRHHGLESFVVRKIRIFETGDEARDYETRFLRKIKARGNPKFYNGHENDGAMNANKMKLIMMELYGVENPFQAEEIKSKIRRTNLEKYGDEIYTRTNDYRQKYTKTCIEKYRVVYHTQAESTKAAQKATNTKNRGVENPSHCPKVVAKISASARKTKGTAKWKATEGKKLGERSKAKFSGNIYITDGHIDKSINPSDTIPEGWKIGRTNSTKGNVFITDGYTNKYIECYREVPEGWRRGITR